MKKSILASAIALTVLGNINAHADIVITNMSFGSDFAYSGSFNDAGTGTASSLPAGKVAINTSTAVQDTGFMDNTAIYNGVSNQGAFDFNNVDTDGDGIGDTDVIANMTGQQRAVGILFNWESGVIVNGISILEIFNCADGICTGNGVPMPNGPFLGAVAVFSGTGSVHAPEVPIPAAAWLMGSGLLGLVGVARRRKAQI